MIVRFFRSRGFDVVLESPRQDRRGFFFELVVGVEAPVDPLSGMTVNLVVVDGWLKALDLSAADGHWALVDRAWTVLEPMARVAGAKLSRVELRDDSGSWARVGDERERVRKTVEFRDGADGVARPYRRHVVESSIDSSEDWKPRETRELTMDGRSARILS